MARPVMYKTVESMSKKADEYFKECSSAGKCPNMLGLTLFLGFKDRHSLYHYSNNHKEFSELITSFKTRIEDIILNKMFDSETGKNQVLAGMFYLKTVHGYKENEVKEYISISEILEKKRQEIKELEENKEIISSVSDNKIESVNVKKKAGRPKKQNKDDKK